MIPYSLRTEEAYVAWIRRFILFNGKRHPDAMGEREIAAFLSNLATRGQVSASTQNQALAAILFLVCALKPVEQPRHAQAVRKATSRGAQATPRE